MVREPVRASVEHEGWGATLLACQDEDGQWAGGAFVPAGFTAKLWEAEGQPWTATAFTFDLLRDLGLPPGCAAEMTSMQIQNPRVYERRGLLDPDRTAGGTRLYSPADIERLHHIAELLNQGPNLAGIAKVLALEEEVRRQSQTQAAARAAPSTPRTTRPPGGKDQACRLPT